MDKFTEKYRGINVIPMRRSRLYPDWMLITRDGQTQYLSGHAADRLAAYEATGLTPEVLKEFAPFLDEMQKNLGAMRRLKELTEADRAGRLVVLPGGDNDAVLAAAFLGEKPMVMHGGGDIDDLIALTHVLVSYAAETLGAGYTDFCCRLGEMSPTGFKNAAEAEAAVEGKEDAT